LLKRKARQAATELGVMVLIAAGDLPMYVANLADIANGWNYVVDQLAEEMPKESDANV